ncbi:hypothetical protein FQR65_LT14284 [Abscondita terminalis]|nr:hypothetical protein FQR65_LT14284 [Abscondita terminalis]
MLVKFETIFIIFFYRLLGSVTVSYPQNEYGNFDNDVHFKNEGDCGEGLNKGVCKMVTECPTSNRALMHRRPHGLERCGFEGKTEIVCCPNEVEPESRAPIITRKSEIACKEFAHDLPPEITFQILGGQNATLGEFPHMAALGYKYVEEDELKWECGASLISKKFLLTAAHCIVKLNRVLPTIVRLGIVDTTGKDNVQPLDIKVKRTIVNPEYLPRLKRNDIALIELETEITKNQYVHPACLYQKTNDPIALVVTGWGFTSAGGDASTVLQKAVLEPVPVSNCSAQYQTQSPRPILGTQICAVSSDGKKDTCSGDSGGPLQIQEEISTIYTIVGVTSYGIGCGGKIPGVYARVSSYLDWIESNVWP